MRKGTQKFISEVEMTNDHNEVPITAEEVEEMSRDGICSCCYCVANLDNIEHLNVEMGEVDELPVVLAVLCDKCKSIFQRMMPFYDAEYFTVISEVTVPMLVKHYIEKYEEKGMKPEDKITITLHGGGSAEEIANEINDFEEYLKEERAKYTELEES